MEYTFTNACKKGKKKKNQFKAKFYIMGLFNPDFNNLVWRENVGI
jgi:hypothetical protein